MRAPANFAMKGDWPVRGRFLTLLWAIGGLLLAGMIMAAETWIRKDGSLWARIETDGSVRIDGSIVGEIETDGTVRKDGSIVGAVEPDGTIRESGSIVGHIEPGGTLRRDGRIIGEIASSGLIRRDGRLWGQSEPGCADFAARRRLAAVLFFFSGEF